MKAIRQLRERLRWRYGITWSWDQVMGVGFVVAVFIVAWIAAAGCQSKVTGGSTLSAHETTRETLPDVESERNDVVVTVDGKRVEVRTGGATTRSSGGDSGTEKTVAATTQPSAAGNGKINLSGNTVSIAPVVERFKNGWWLGIGFLLVAGYLGHFLHRYVLAAVVFALGIIAILEPAWLLGLALGAIGLAVWANWKTIRELISGNQAVLERVNPDTATAYKDTMRKRHSTATQAMVKAAK